MWFAAVMYAVSYASEDRAVAEWVRDRLLDRGAASVWMDREEIEGGDPWKREIDNGLRRTQVVVAVLTRTSVDPARVWIVYEQLEAGISVAARRASMKAWVQYARALFAAAAEFRFID